MGRFLNVDNQLNIADMSTGTNLFAYCGNDPVNRVDPTGEDWWHWVLGATIVVGCAVATVATCGGFAAAAGAVAAVGSGVAAATTASTIAAGALIGSATVYGMAVVTAATTSNSVKEFNDKGNWGTVAATAGGAILGGVSAGASAHMSTNRSSNNKTPVIGKMNDLNQLKLKKNEFKIADLLPDMGSPKANWKQNSGVLRSYMDGRAIRDVSPYPMNNAGFLGAERNLLANHGYKYSNGYWIMP